MSTKNVNAENDTEAPSTDCPVVLPDGWTFRHDGGYVVEHEEAGLRVKITKQYGQSGRHDDFKWTGTIRREGGIGEPLTWGGSPERDQLLASAAKFAAATPDGEYDPADHEPDNAWEWERPRWPAALGADDYFASIEEWRAD
ncbi:hypothetical protein [Halorussus sp. AFM4]|uniref:hypothetical protein n=1 Tax=Halorussus sp. AFM4 TaxID=3421651 RepID=UPI003EC082A2